ncbi:helix-turn-helix transcriptional regulator [Nocardia callitridis]|uniref:AraC family transcriptional regulator n=1 Tax=Nocardia callitridis TaxID=648753 RepID=A0ABP9L1K7_9NOCA
MVGVSEVTAWRPRVSGIEEVFHAHFTDHAYPMHAHGVWTLLIVDAGAITYELGGHAHGSTPNSVTLLPPHVPHNGRAADPSGFHKRVIYLAADLLTDLGAAVDAPAVTDPLLRDRVHRLHHALRRPGEELEAQSRLVFVLERLRGHLRREIGATQECRDPALAGSLRDLLDARVRTGITLEQAAELLHADPAYLVRTFSRHFGIAPHQYLIGRRVELARRLLLSGCAPAQAAVTAGFHDQPHLTRHFKRMLGTTPARFATSGRTHRG